MPMIISSKPKKMLMYLNQRTVFEMSFCASPTNIPSSKKGSPNPRVYATSKINAPEGCEVDNARIAPNAALTQGLQPMAKAAPKTKEVIYDDLNFWWMLSLYSVAKNWGFIRPIK